MEQKDTWRIAHGIGNGLGALECVPKDSLEGIIFGEIGRKYVSNGKTENAELDRSLDRIADMVKNLRKVEKDAYVETVGFVFAREQSDRVIDRYQLGRITYEVGLSREKKDRYRDCALFLGGRLFACRSRY